MKTFALFVLLMTPKPDCIARIQHDNLGKCSPEPRGEYYFSNGVLCDDGRGGWHTCPGSSDAKATFVCALVDNPKPLPKADVKISAERPDIPRDDCYDYKVGVIDVPISDPFSGFSNVEISSVIFATNKVIRGTK